MSSHQPKLDNPANEPALDHGARVLVIIVNYKTAPFTLRALESLKVERPTLGNRLRAYVVENASGDAAVLSTAIQGGRGKKRKVVSVWGRDYFVAAIC